MNSSIDQLHALLRAANINFYFNSDGRTTLIKCGNAAQPLDIYLARDKDNLTMYARDILTLSSSSPNAILFYEELLSLNGDFDIARVYRSPSTGQVDIFHQMPWPDANTTAEALACVLDQFEDEVRGVRARILMTAMTGMTTADRTTADSIRQLFSDCCDEFPNDANAADESTDDE